MYGRTNASGFLVPAGPVRRVRDELRVLVGWKIRVHRCILSCTLEASGGEEREEKHG